MLPRNPVGSNKFRKWWQPYQPHPGTHCHCCGCSLPGLTGFTAKCCEGTDTIAINFLCPSLNLDLMRFGLPLEEEIMTDLLRFSYVFWQFLPEYKQRNHDPHLWPGIKPHLHSETRPGENPRQPGEQWPHQNWLSLPLYSAVL